MQDILSIPVTGAGVERLFNTVRDIFHYRRGWIKSETIKEIIMFLCTSRFDLDKQKAEILKEFFSIYKIEAGKEEQDKKLEDIKIELISDTKELDSKAAIVVQDHAEPELPDNIMQARASGRLRKQKDREDGEFKYY